MGNAPSEISLWHFDEGNVFWQEEGQATLINGSYEGNVSHFSFWNCDNPTPAIYLEMILHDQFNQPLSGMGLKAINTIDNSYTYGLSSASGWVGGLVPMNTNLTLEAYYSFYSFPCGPQSPVYSQTLSVGNGNINLGILTLNIPSTVTTVEGVTVDCSNSPVSNIALYMLNYNQMVYTNSNGQFKFILPCLGSGQVSLALIDLNNTSGSTPNALTATNYNIVSGVNNIGYYTLCDTMLRFMQYTIQDTTGITKTINNVIPSGGAVAQINYNTNTIDFSSGPTPVYFTSQDTTLGTHPITKAFFYLPPDPTTDPFETYFELNNALTNTITITQFPNGPGLIAGSFSINLKGQGTGFKYYATGTFRAYRSN
jgi:hypothetical protein